MTRHQRTWVVSCVSLVCSIALIGTAFKVSDKRGSLHELEERVHEDVTRADEAERRAVESAQALRDAVSMLANTPSPIKVRGGSMTAFTRNKWIPINGGVSYCSLIDDSSKIQFEGASIPVQSFPWKLKMYGTSPDIHDEGNPSTHYDRFDPSPRGIQLTGYQQTDCSQQHDPLHDSIVLESFGGLPAGFYPKDLKQAGNKKENKRFRDSSSECVTEPDNSGKGDRELCERMRRVDLVSGFAASTPTPRQCPDGDCELLLGTIAP